jgi:hypothetical protein
VNPFWFAGGAAALWALVLTFAFGLRSENFPRNDGQMRAVVTVSIILVAAAIGTAIYGGVSGAGKDKGVRRGPEVAKNK